MDIITFSEQLQQQLKVQADATAAANQEPLVSSARMIAIVQELIHDLQQFTYNYSFEDQQEEIKFFKEVKPVLISQYYYYKKLFSIHLYDSYKEPESRRRHYEIILGRMEQYARKNNDFFLYCMTGQTYFDDKYFTRKGKSFSALIDRQFSTGYDEKLARLLSHELIKNTILDSLRKLNTQSSNASPVNWTGKKTDAIELLFALHASGNINNGEAEVKQIAAIFEELFNIKLGNYFDVLRQIRMRKGGRTNFLDKLKENFLFKLERMEN